MSRRYEVEGIRCDQCRAALTQAIQARDSDARVLVDITGGTMQVEAQLSDRQVREAIEQAGYRLR